MIQLRCLGIILLASMLGACGSHQESQRASASNEPLSFILIYTDELQFSDLACYGGQIPTPHIDQLARDGLLFRNAYTTASMCTPSRYSVLTGQFPGRCTAASFLKENPEEEPYTIAWNTWITPDKRPLPEVLREHGFVTGMAGKWHVGEIPEGIVLPDYRADDSLDDPQVDLKLKAEQQIHQQLVKEGGGFDYAASVVWGNYDSHPIKALHFHNFPWMAQGAMDFLEQQEAAVPFFLYLAPTAIHGPNHRADLEQDVSYTRGGKNPAVARFQLDTEALIEEMDEKGLIDQHRYAGIVQTDHLVGLVRKKLEEKGLSDQTVIIFTADHNIEPGKATSFEKGIHVPLIICWPGRTKGGLRDALVQNIDLYPTILDAAGIPAPESHRLDGKSIKKIIDDPDLNIRQWVFSENGFTRSVSDGRYKYIALRYPGSLVRQMEDGTMDHVPSYVKAWPQAHSAIAMHFFPAYFDQDQFYDLEADPYEQENKYKEWKDREELKEMKAALARHLESFPHPFPLEEDPFLASEAFRRLTRKNLSFDIYSIPWLSRDHGEMEWPPSEE